MLPLPPFERLAPSTLAEVVALLEQHGDDAAVIAGGTDLLPNMKQGLLAPRRLVSVARVASLRGVQVKREAGVIRVGAMTTLDAVTRDPSLSSAARALVEAARAVGGPHHRRMGTLGGNLCLDTRCRYYNQSHFWRSALGFCLKKDGSECHVVRGGRRCVAAASNDCAAAVIALGATLGLLGPAGPRELSARDFYTADGVRNVALRPGELVTHVDVPVVEGRASAYEKLRLRGAIDFPLLSVAARADVTGGVIRDLDVVVSALAARPRRVRGAALGVGAAAADLPIDSIAEAALAECAPLANVDGDVAWRREMVPVLVTRALGRLFAGG